MCFANIKLYVFTIQLMFWLKGGTEEERDTGTGPEISEINIVLLALYMVLTQTILINFLIAMFS